MKVELNWLLDMASGVGEWGKAKFTDAGDLFRRFERGAQLSEMSSQTTLALGQNLLGGATDNVWTVLTAPNDEELARRSPASSIRACRGRSRGRSRCSTCQRRRSNRSPSPIRDFVITQPLSVGNARLIAAGWLSLHSLYFVGAAIVIGFLLALTTRAFVKNVGRRTP